MILGVMLVLCKVLLALNGSNRTNFKDAGEAIIFIFFGCVSVGLYWVDMAQKGFLCNLIYEIRQLIK